MKCNVGGWHRTLRLVAGTAALGIGLLGLRGRRRALALGLGAVELTTGLSRYCPLNRALGINTCPATKGLLHRVAELV